jgi:hypothetical protein
MYPYNRDNFSAARIVIYFLIYYKMLRIHKKGPPPACGLLSILSWKVIKKPTGARARWNNGDQEVVRRPSGRHGDPHDPDAEQVSRVIMEAPT